MALDFPVNPSDGDIYSGFIWVEAQGAWRKIQQILTLDTNISDVEITSPTSGQALTYDGTKWVNATPASDLPSLTDVDISNPVVGQTLVYNGTQWVNADQASSFDTAFLLGA